MKHRKKKAKSMVMHPIFRTRKVGAKKGRGSYTRKDKHREAYS